MLVTSKKGKQIETERFKKKKSLLPIVRLGRTELPELYNLEDS